MFSDAVERTAEHPGLILNADHVAGNFVGRRKRQDEESFEPAALLKPHLKVLHLSRKQQHQA